VKNDLLNEGNKNNQILYVAIGSIISPGETMKFYKELINYISGKINIPIELKQRKTYEEVNLMLETGQVDFAFICSGAYAKESENSLVDILVVPVSNGKTLYQAYIIANKNSDINKFEDLKGKSFAFTDPISNTGRFYVMKRLANLGSDMNIFFRKWIFTYAHDYSLQLVNKNTIDGASVNSLVFDYLVKTEPEKVENIKIIEKSEFYGIPPVVVPRTLNTEMKNKLKNIFLNIANDEEGKKILEKLFIEKYVEGKDSDYNSVRDLQKFAK
jgi:phosphonate transport system substrate-binding protein